MIAVAGDVHGHLQLAYEDPPILRKEPPPGLRELARHPWTALPDGRLVCPPLAHLVWGQSD